MRPQRGAIRLALVAALSALLLTAGFAPAPASADAGCLPEVGKRLPVLFVHGLFGTPQQWGSKNDPATIVGKVDAIKGVTTDIFNYSQFAAQWVTNPHIGKALAGRIACMAASSRTQGGAGKVVVVAHSMGGLATREAIKEQPQILNDLGIVFTIATPNTGSDVGRTMLDQTRTVCLLVQCGADVSAAIRAMDALPALATGSTQLAALPDWPTSLPVYAIGGNITPVYHLPYFDLGSFRWKTMDLDGAPSNTDTLVTTESALHGVKVRRLGGTATASCKADAPVLPFVTHATCEHGALIGNSSVQEEVVKQIKAYLASQAAPTPSPSKSNGPVHCGPAKGTDFSGSPLELTTTVTKGSPGCKVTLQTAVAFLGSEVGSSGANRIGIWDCVYRGSRDAICVSKDGEFTIKIGGG